jgi:hypothetical protein
MINQIFMNLTKNKQIFTKAQKNEITLFAISHNLLLFQILQCILLYLFANAPFKCC